MDQNEDFSALRNLLALKKLETPMDTEVNRFLIEFHRRQRAQLLVPASFMARATEWLKEKVAGFELAPSLSYTSAFAAIALAAFVSFSQQVQVTHAAGGSSYQLSLHLPNSQSAFAMIPASFGATSSVAKADSPNFSANRFDSATTRFVLATNSHSAYDANVAF